MARVKRGVTTHARHKKVIKLAKGYRGRGGTNYRIALEKVEKALRYAYRDRKARKREFRALWIQRINAGARAHGRDRDRPQGPLRPRDRRAGVVYELGQASPGRSRRLA
jgi:large subunit ribosomal protein L20